MQAADDALNDNRNDCWNHDRGVVSFYVDVPMSRCVDEISWRTVYKKRNRRNCRVSGEVLLKDCVDRQDGLDLDVFS